MAIKNYTTKTASLKATTADIRKVEAKQVQADAITVKDGDEYKSVTALIDEAETAASTALADVKTELEGKIQDAQEAAAISVGRDEDKNWGVANNEVTKLVKQINFLGDYVNVVPATDDSGTVQVYIGENKSLNGISGLSGAPSTASYISYTNADYTVTGGASKNYHGVKTVGNTAGYSNVTLKSNVTASNIPVGSTSTSTEIFTTGSSENKIWFRATINGTTGATASQALSADLTNKTVSENNVTLTTTNKVITTAHAKDGKIPGQTETSFKFTFDPDTLVPNGGSIKLEWGISKEEPTSWKAVDLFYGEYTATPTASAITASMTKEVLTDKISGMQYLTAESEVNVKVASLTNSQNKITKSLNRFQITDATNGTTTYAVKADGTMTDGMTETSDNGALSSSAVFALDKTLKTGSKVAASSFTISGKTWDYNDADGSPSVSLTSTTINRPYYGTLTDSTNLVENFSKENKRTNEAMVAWTKEQSDTLFTGTENVINGRVPAVVQMGKLYHPANTSIIADANGNKPSSSDSEAVFYRVVKTSDSATGDTPKLKLTGSNLNNSNVGIYLTAIKADGSLEAKTWIVNKEPSVSDAIGTGIAAAGGVSATQVLFDFNTTLGVRPRECDGFLLMIVLKKGAPALGPMTFAKQ